MDIRRIVSQKPRVKSRGTQTDSPPEAGILKHTRTLLTHAASMIRLAGGATLDFAGAFTRGAVHGAATLHTAAALGKTAIFGLGHAAKSWYEAMHATMREAWAEHPIWMVRELVDDLRAQPAHPVLTWSPPREDPTNYSPAWEMPGEASDDESDFNGE